MNGAESLVSTLVAGGVNVCFTNPGTSEMHFVAALDAEPRMRSVLALFEGVATGAADGFYRMTDRPAATLLHLGPGLANGLANLHNAKKAGSGVVNIVGEHAIPHLALDAPLASDIEGLSRPMSHWIRTSTSAADVGRDGAEAIGAAMAPPGQVATLILPGDTAWNAGGEVAETPAAATRQPVAETAVDAAAAALNGGGRVLLLLGGAGVRADALVHAGKIAAKTDCGLLTEWSNTRLDRGAGRVDVLRIPYVVEKAVAILEEYDTVVLAGAAPPVAFFAYPDKPGVLTRPGAKFVRLAEVEEDVEGALAALSAALDASDLAPMGVAEPHRPEIVKGPPTPPGIAAVLGALLPDQAIVVDESVTTGREFFPLTSGAPPHSWLNNRGGSIGYGMPVAIGAAIACPDRKVVALEGDGSAMYTVQSLWTMARENLDITVLIFANRTYRILLGELTNVGVQNPGPRALDMLTLDRPNLGWVAMAQGMGVTAEKVSTCEDLAEAFASALSNPGPNLIEIEM